MTAMRANFRLDLVKAFQLKHPPRKIHRCFERVNQLLSSLVPVDDINRAAAGSLAGGMAAAKFCKSTFLSGTHR
jgi:hypothetical protein